MAIASTCNEVYRKLFVEENKISVFIVRGYQSGDQQSGICILLDGLVCKIQNTIGSLKRTKMLKCVEVCLTK